MKDQTHKRHLVKAVTWRIVGTIDTILLSWLISGNPLVGLKIGLSEVITNTDLIACNNSACLMGLVKYPCMSISLHCRSSLICPMGIITRIGIVLNSSIVLMILAKSKLSTSGAFKSINIRSYGSFEAQASFSFEMAVLLPNASVAEHTDEWRYSMTTDRLLSELSTTSTLVSSDFTVILC